MKRNLCTEDQTHLWPDDEMNSLAGHPKLQPPLPPLPFERNEEIDVARCARILAISRANAERMVKREKWGYQVNTGPRSKPVWRIKKDAVLKYCDDLRLKYLIAPRRPSAGRWPKDEDFLPFPWAETCELVEVMEAIDISRNQAIKLVDCGAIVAYQLSGKELSKYRVHRPSLARYLESLRAQVS